MSTKELLLLCYIFLKSLYLGIKALIKAGGIWIVVFLCVGFFVVPSIVEQYNLKNTFDLILLLCICWFIIRSVVRLVKKDKQWGSLTRRLKSTKQTDVHSSHQ